MLERSPIVSVIIPTYNRAHLIVRAIQSVLDQTYEDFELIVVDDGSTDDSEAVVRGLGDGRIRYVKHNQTKGGGAARNTGIKLARGDYIAFQDSDDEWLPDKLEKQMKVFETAPAEVGVVYTGFYRVEDDNRTYIPSTHVRQKEGDIHSSLLLENFVTTQASLVKKECFAKAGAFDETLPRLQDWELWLRISKDYQFRCVDEPLVMSYHQPDSISADETVLIRAFQLVLEKHFLDIRTDRKLLAKHYFRIASLLQSNGEFEQARHYLVKCGLTYPLDIRYLGAAAASLLGKSGYSKVGAMYRIICGRFLKGH